MPKLPTISKAELSTQVYDKLRLQLSDLGLYESGQSKDELVLTLRLPDRNPEVDNVTCFYGYFFDRYELSRWMKKQIRMIDPTVEEQILDSLNEIRHCLVEAIDKEHPFDVQKEIRETLNEIRNHLVGSS